MFRNSRSFYGTNRPESRHEQTTPVSHDSRHEQGSQPRRRRLHSGALQQPSHSESPVSTLRERNGHVESEQRCSSTGARAYGPGMLLRDNPGTSVPGQRDMHWESEDESDRENLIPPPHRRTSSPLSTTPLSQDMEERTDLRTLLQQQQGVLMRILNNQAVMEEKHAQLEAKLKDMEQKLSTPTSVSSDSPVSSGGKRKRVVSRVLTVSVYLSELLLV